jgi:hypothetical protein
VERCGHDSEAGSVTGRTTLFDDGEAVNIEDAGDALFEHAPTIPRHTVIRQRWLPKYHQRTAGHPVRVVVKDPWQDVAAVGLDNVIAAIVWRCRIADDLVDDVILDNN